jgi:CheY-like chemotaxis protein
MRKLSLVVIADDNRIFRIVLREILERLAVRVIEAADGDAALEAVRTHSPDLVISDILMPKRDGLGLISAISRDPAIPRPVFFLTTAVYKSQQMRHEARSTYGADEFLLKPVEPDQLVKLIRKHFELEDEVKEKG